MNLGHNRLADLAAQVREANNAMESALTTAAERALQIGHLLLTAKDECVHGQWLPFLKNAGFAERQAQRFMTLARSGLKTDTVSDLGIKAALNLANGRKLPKPGECLIVAVGEKPEGAPDSTYGEITSWVWESRKHPGYFHINSWQQAIYDAGRDQVAATRRPVSGEMMVFAHVDMCLDYRFADMRFSNRPWDDILVGRDPETIFPFIFE